jgi:hypothetical protein
MSETIPVRLSHVLRHCSVGAIVRGPDYLMIVKDIREWTDRNGHCAARLLPYVDQVRTALGIKQELREPPKARQNDNGQIEGTCIPAMRFPCWMRCPACGELRYRPWRSIKTGEKPRCGCERKAQLEQITWVLTHPDGYLSDVPLHQIAHKDARRRKEKQCRPNWEQPNLKLLDTNGFGWKVLCTACKASGEIRQDMPFHFFNPRRQPWLFLSESEASTPSDSKGKEEPGRVVGINDVRVHFPTTQNGIVIPPESRIRKGTVVDRLYRSSQKRQQIDTARNDFARRGLFKAFASEFRCDPEEVEDAWKEVLRGYPLYGATTTPGLLLESEYDALTHEIPDVSDDEDFVTCHFTEKWRALAEGLAKPSKSYRVARCVTELVTVSRLKEIQVFKGFTRGGRQIVPPDIIGQSEWLPAIELYGEGIFFTLDEILLQNFEKRPAVIERAGISQRRYERTIIPGCNDGAQPVSTPRFLLMHTLAHLLIRQIESEAGYPAASLKERIYSSNGGRAMSGILIYVAVPDSVGSLGGLAEIGDPKRFLALLCGAFDHAEWCSLDPVCAEGEGQGPQLLNRAACHACALIPEPSCAFRNVLLDRVFIKGDLKEGIPPILQCVDVTG